MTYREESALEPSSTLRQDQRQIGLWLLVCCALVFSMVVVGGVTRLTGSGLSIVEWEPILGVIPPLNEHEWEEAFAKYRQSPEFMKINHAMTVESFKSIYWLEYFHRLLGRGIGFAFLIPFLYFWTRRKISPSLVPRLAVMFVLGGLQGAMGWYMVKSGLVDNPHVSQYRLVAHLGLAFLIYAYILWVALDLLFPKSAPRAAALRPLKRQAAAVTAFAAVTILAGGFVAGLKAGFAFNTFPLMDGRWVPEGLFIQDPWWINIFENVITVQFNHRLLAIGLLVLVMGLWLGSRRHELPSRTRLAFHLLPAFALIQVTLGIATLLLRVPISLASAHQAGALVLLTVLLFINHELSDKRLPRAQYRHQASGWEKAHGKEV